MRRPGRTATLVPAVLAVGLLVVLAAATAPSWGIVDRFGWWGDGPDHEPRELPPLPSAEGTPSPVEDSGAGSLVLPVLWAALVLLVFVVAYWVWRVLPRPAAKAPVTAATAGLALSGSSPDAPTVHRGVIEAQVLLDSVADPTDAVVAAWVALEEAAARSGVPRRPADTPTELATRVLTATEADAGAVTTLLGLYHRARFSTVGVGPDAVVQARRCLTVLAAGWSRFSAGPGPGP